jgi:PiT family inorganic phosphate transporter
MEIVLFLSSGLFLGWSLGANDAANVFGTAVGTRMVSFRTAATVCSIGVFFGAVISGAGAAHSLGKLGAVNALPGSFTVALAAALTTYWMTRLHLPVSTSQAVVGAILGWNLYSSSVTDMGSLSRIVASWVICPLLAGAIAVGLFVLVRWGIGVASPHLLELDTFTRTGLLVVGAFGSYSLGANNIANVMGVFITDNPFTDLSLFGLVSITGAQQLFGLGALAIGVGVFTYSERVMRTVGGGLARLSPVPALVIVAAHSITLFLFASEGLEHALASRGLPTLPLVPVSSSQAVIGAIVGLSLFKGVALRYRTLGGISMGWVATPVVAGVVAFFLLFFVENVFNQQVSKQESFRLDAAVREEGLRRGIDTADLMDLGDGVHTNAVTLQRRLWASGLSRPESVELLELARLGRWSVDPAKLVQVGEARWLSAAQLDGLHSLRGQTFVHAWQLEQALAASTEQWRPRPDATVNKLWNRELKEKLSYLVRVLQGDITDAGGVATAHSSANDNEPRSPAPPRSEPPSKESP